MKGGFGDGKGNLECGGGGVRRAHDEIGEGEGYWEDCV